mgnify:CR=1 FL=1
MNWIKIEDREPKQGQLVLVKGQFDSDFETTKNTIGLVYFNEVRYSPCSHGDNVWFSNITEWCEVE